MTRERLIALLAATVDATPESVSGGILICNRRDVAPLAFLHRIYPVLSDEELELLAEQIGRPIPSAYTDFLTYVGNGAKLFELGLNGFVAQLRRDATDPLGQPISLSYGNTVERPRGLEGDAIAIGGMVGWSARGVLVMRQSGEIMLVHPVDGQEIAARWPSLDNMLESEIDRHRTHYDRAGRRLVSAAESMHPGGWKWETEVEPRPKQSRKFWLR